MAITSAKGMVWHVARREPNHGRTQMKLFAIAAAMIVTGFAVWAAAPSNARVPSTTQGIEPIQLMMNAKHLPTEEFVDYSFVFVH